MVISLCSEADTVVGYTSVVVINQNDHVSIQDIT